MTTDEALKRRARGWLRFCLMALVVPILISFCAGCSQGNTSSNKDEIRAKHKKTSLNPNDMKVHQPLLDRLKG